MRKRGVLVGGGLFVLVALGFAWLAAPAFLDGRWNRVHAPPPYEASAEAHELHSRLLVADLHADTLLWNRNILTRSRRGHVDLPRLQEGNVAVQVFSAVTHAPFGVTDAGAPASRSLPEGVERDATDAVGALAIAQRWPPRTWRSPLERALYQAERLHAAAARSEGVLRVITTEDELNAFLQDRADDSTLVGAILSIEGAQTLEGELANVDRLYEAGYRLIGLSHFVDTEVGGSVHGAEGGGLTEFGRQVIERMESLGMGVDLAHASPALVEDVLASVTQPVAVSHTGVQAVCPGPRNLSDDQLQNIAEAGGVIGIGFWRVAVCGDDTAAIVRSIEHAVDMAGVEHVALGSDFDGVTATPFDVTGLPQITEGLLDAGFSEDDIARIMGENTIEYFRRVLPKVS